MRAILLASIFAACLAAPAAAQSLVSTYTPLDLDKCRHTRGKDVEDYGAWQCAGFQGIGVRITAGDMRMYVSYGREAKNEPAARETLASFHGEGTTIEWRSERSADGKFTPFATILRFRTTVSDGDKSATGQVLVVTRLPPGAVCRVGYVDGRANPDANALAQKIADEIARNFKCGSDKPVFLGNKGPGFSGPYGN